MIDYDDAEMQARLAGVEALGKSAHEEVQMIADRVGELEDMNNQLANPDFDDLTYDAYNGETYD